MTSSGPSKISRKKWWLRASLIPCVLLPIGSFALGQELEPRAYQPAPVGLNGFTLAYSNSSGETLTDPSFPVKDFEGKLHISVVAYYRSFGLAGRFANLLVSVPYVRGHMKGSVEGVEREIHLSGLGDMQTRVAVNLVGTPAMGLAEFVKHKNKTSLGVSLAVKVPTGQYDPQKVINIGQNRWAFKPEVELSKFFNRWQMDIYGGVWLFTKNRNFLGKTRTQDPLGEFQFHLSYNLRPTWWVGLDLNYFTGGRPAVNGVPSSIILKNSRIGATAVIPIKKGQFVKFNVSRGLIVPLVGDYINFGVAYNYAWMSK